MLNLTRGSDGEWRALRNDEIVKATKYLGAVYRAELAAELQKLGYELRHERQDMFELASMKRAQLAAFSQRAAQTSRGGDTFCSNLAMQARRPWRHARGALASAPQPGATVRSHDRAAPSSCSRAPSGSHGRTR